MVLLSQPYFFFFFLKRIKDVTQKSRFLTSLEKMSQTTFNSQDDIGYSAGQNSLQNSAAQHKKGLFFYPPETTMGSGDCPGRKSHRRWLSIVPPYLQAYAWPQWQGKREVGEGQAVKGFLQERNLSL